MKNITHILIYFIFLYALNITHVNAFIVKKIKIEGLQRLSFDTVYNKIPIKIGESVNEFDIEKAIKAIFSMDHFSNVQHIQDTEEKNTLIFKVYEHPTISKIKFEGNRSISRDQLKKILINASLSDGDLFRPNTLHELQKALAMQYYAQGRYNAQIEPKITHEPKNKIKINLVIKEGDPTTVQNINIVGAQAFKKQTLLKLMPLTTKQWNSLFLKNHEYSSSKLQNSTEALKAHYLNHGYINFEVLSTQVAISPDKKSMYITININENKQYIVKNIQLIGDFVREKNLDSLLTIKKDQLFSQQDITQTSLNITHKLGEIGYILSSVKPTFDIDHQSNTVDITLEVISNKAFYVRYINFHTDTNKTRDEVCRREMRQLEGAIAESKNIALSTLRLNQLGFFKEVWLTKTPVPNTDNQVDLNYQMQESQSGKINLEAGYAPSQGLMLGISAHKNNFLGTGKTIGSEIQGGKQHKTINFHYFEPYFTANGISQGLNFSYNHTQKNEKFSPTTYHVNRMSFMNQFSYPLSNITRLSLAFGLSKTEILNATSNIPFILDFFKKYPSKFQTFSTTLSWSQFALNYAVLPTSGFQQNIIASLDLSSKSAANVYKLIYKGSYLKKLSSNFSLKCSLNLNYANTFFNSKEFPFYDHFTLGGIHSMRGFEAMGLQANGLRGYHIRLGGNVSTQGTLAVVFPIPFLTKYERSLQAQVFVDVGNVWSSTVPESKVIKTKNLLNNATESEVNFQTLNISPGIRCSAGIALTWITFIGPISVSFAKTIKKQPNDETKIFQMALGHSF
ncbi:MAG: outer membrane protein assembly factor BamA [Endozoicomonadaceae bacterium]|nr:outer membrane protein assembly factor BamA [Endozoicomonadaceae bacterium]